MKRLLITATFFCLSFCLSGVNAAEVSSVQGMADRWVTAYNSHDEVVLGAIYTKNAQLYMHGRHTIAGRKNIQAFWKGDFEEGSPITVLNVTHSVDGIDMILVHGNYQVINRTSGTSMGKGRFAHIWTKDKNNNWGLDRDLWYAAFEPY